MSDPYISSSTSTWFLSIFSWTLPYQCLSTAFGINSILYQRGIYPPETFTRVTHYDMTLQLTTDPKLKNYLTNVVSQLKGTGAQENGPRDESPELKEFSDSIPWFLML